MREAFWHTNEVDYFEHNFIFESDDFFLRIDVEGVSLYFDDKTKRLIENFYQRDEPNLKYNSLSLAVEKPKFLLEFHCIGVLLPVLL